MSTILLIEDDPILNEIYTNLFSADHIVLSASSGDEALKQLNTAKPDLVLLDVMLPDVSGDVLLEKIRALPDCRDLKVLALTNMSNETLTRKLRGLAVLDVLTKVDYSPDQLLSVVESYLS